MKKKLLHLFVLFIFCTITSRTLAQGVNCNAADPFCTGTTYVFPNNTGVPDMGTMDCLLTTPNPAWYYLQIATPGNIDIFISQVNGSGVGIDVDFDLWGPFASVPAGCTAISSGTSSIDCSYSTAATETANIVGASTGQFYLLLLTNFSNQPGTITFSQTGGSGTTDCSIVIPCTSPTAGAGPTLTLSCSTTSVTLSGTSSAPSSTYSWTGPGGFTSTLQNPTVSVAGTYTVTVTDPANAACPSTATQTVNAAVGAPNITTGAGSTLTCVVISTSLTGGSSTGGVTYSWSGPGGFSSSSASPGGVTTPGTYTLTITDPSNGCTSTGTETVSINTTPPNASADTPQTITCTTTSATVTGSSTTPGATFVWSGPGGFTASTGTASGATTAGTYTVTITDPANGCTATATQDVLLNTTTPNASAGTPQEITCITLSATVTGSSTTPGATFGWSGPGGFTASGASASGATTVGTYTVTITDPANGCTATATQDVILNTTPPNAGAGATENITCIDTIANLSGTSTTPGATYSWSGPGGFSSSLQNPIASALGTYTVTITDPANGCTATATQTVNTTAVFPNAGAGITQTLTCITTSVNLSGTSTTPGVTYAWTGPGGFTSTSQNPSAATAGTYTVIVTDPSNGCVSTATQVVTSNTTPPIADAGTGMIFPCTATGVNLDGSGSSSGASYTYSWTTSDGTIVSGSTTTAPVAGETGTYTLTVTDATNGCTSTDVVIVSPDVFPVASFISNPNSGMAPLIVNFTNTSTGATSYLWNYGNGVTSNAFDSTMTYDGYGNYTVTLIVTNANGCSDTITGNIFADAVSFMMIPNVFTPNGDLENNVFMVSADAITMFEGQVFDRWGLKMFEWTDVNQGWDGKAKNGAPAPDGTYFYIINAKGFDGKDYQFKGYLSLVR